MENKRIYNEKVTDLKSMNDLLAGSVVEKAVEPELNEVTDDTQTENISGGDSNVADVAVPDDSEPTGSTSEESEQETTEIKAENTEEEIVLDGETEVQEEVAEQPEEDIYSDWDEANETTVTTESQEGLENLSDIAKEFGLEASTQDEFVSALRDKYKDNKSEKELLTDALSDLPQDLVDAVKLAKDGGDYRTLLEASVIDYNSVSDEAIYGNYLESRFIDADGNIDKEGLQTHLDSLTEHDLMIRAGEVRDSLFAQQDAAKRQAIARNEEKKERAEAGVKKALSSFEDVNGFKVRPDDKKAIYDSVVNDTLIKDLFYGEDGKIDYSKVCNVAFRNQNFSSITKYLATRNQNEGKRKIIKTMTNPEVKVGSTPVNASPSDNSPRAQQLKMIKALKGES